MDNQPGITQNSQMNNPLNAIAYPNAYNLFKNEITLPLYSTLSDEQVDYIIETLLYILK